MTAIAVTIAGSDSGGGAGIQADLKSFSALGVYGACVITALTAQNTQGVRGIHAVPADFVRAQIDAVFSDLPVNAVKIGMLADPQVIEAVAAGLDAWKAEAVVLDPVMIATSGDALIGPEAVSTLRDLLLRRALIITPNLPESARLLDQPIASDRQMMERQAEALLKLGSKAVMLKGGHGSGTEAADLLLSEEGPLWLTAKRHETANTHGTGCTLSAAIAASLAKGRSLADAASLAKSYVTNAIRAADQLKIGHGHGPVHHFHEIWGERR